MRAGMGARLRCGVAAALVGAAGAAAKDPLSAGFKPVVEGNFMRSECARPLPPLLVVIHDMRVAPPLPVVMRVAPPPPPPPPVRAHCSSRGLRRSPPPPPNRWFARRNPRGS